MGKVYSPDIDIFSNSVVRWWNEIPGFEHLLKFETTWRKEAWNQVNIWVKFRSIFQFRQLIFFPAKSRYFSVFNIEFNHSNSITHLLLSRSGHGPGTHSRRIPSLFRTRSRSYIFSTAAGVCVVYVIALQTLPSFGFRWWFAEVDQESDQGPTQGGVGVNPS